MTIVKEFENLEMDIMEDNVLNKLLPFSFFDEDKVAVEAITYYCQVCETLELIGY